MPGMLYHPELIPLITKGIKTHTRRAEASLKEINLEPDKWWLVASFDDNTAFRFGSDILDRDLTIKPRYHVGETVYIKEAHYCYGYWIQFGKGWRFRATERMRFLDNPPEDILKNMNCHKTGWFKRSPLFLPAKFARHFTKIKGVQAERFYLDKLTSDELLKEGGDLAVPYLKLIDRLWVFNYTFEYSEVIHAD